MERKRNVIHHKWPVVCLVWWFMMDDLRSWVCCKKTWHFSLLSVSSLEYICQEGSECIWNPEWFTSVYNHKESEIFGPILFTAGLALLLPKTLIPWFIPSFLNSQSPWFLPFLPWILPWVLPFFLPWFLHYFLPSLIPSFPKYYLNLGNLKENKEKRGHRNVTDEAEKIYHNVLISFFFINNKTKLGLELLKENGR